MSIWIPVLWMVWLSKRSETKNAINKADPSGPGGYVKCCAYFDAVQCYTSCAYILPPQLIIVKQNLVQIEWDWRISQHLRSREKGAPKAKWWLVYFRRLWFECEVSVTTLSQVMARWSFRVWSLHANRPLGSQLHLAKSHNKIQSHQLVLNLRFLDCKISAAIQWTVVALDCCPYTWEQQLDS